jgi:hypothetical protein
MRSWQVTHETKPFSLLAPCSPRLYFNVICSVDLHQFNADPDPVPSCHFNADPDPNFLFNADPDPALAPRPFDSNLLPLVERLSGAQVYASIVSVYGPGRLHFKPLKIRLSSIRIRIRLFTLMRIRIQLPKMVWIQICDPSESGDRY